MQKQIITLLPTHILHEQCELLECMQKVNILKSQIYKKCENVNENNDFCLYAANLEESLKEMLEFQNNLLCA